ncbi:AEC family transporter [Aliisedimentitalea scapharcae]|uniref:AEC family transporter n=1 Tax=Aliisedimentitalea scapharcae TaxID=1524259 RepID=A0ABZ2XWJ6_9RHOB
MFDQLLNGVLPVFAIGALGFVFGLRGIFDFNMAMALNKFVMFVAMPALGFRLLANAPLGDFNLVMLGGYFVTELLIYTAGFLIARRIFKADVMEAALLGSAIALTNHILFVLPIAITLFGEGAVTPIVAIISMDGMLIFSGSLILMDVLATKGASLGHTIGKIARNPPLVAMALGLVVGVLGLSVPRGFDVFTDFLGGTASPVLLFALGVILSQKVSGSRPMLPVVITGVKLVVHPLLAWAIFAGVLQLAPEERNPAMMVAAAPCGVMAFMMALNYGVRVDAIARAILYSSIGSLVTVTLAAAL